jgi:hypothetical protein
VKRLVGRTDLEDSLKRLDKLAHEEARMATAQVLKVTHTVGDRVGVVDGRVRVVEGKVASVDDRVRAVNDNVVGVIEGEQITFSPWLRKRLTLMRIGGREVRVAVQRAVDDIDQVKR